MDVVADEAHRAGGEDADGLGLEEVIGLLDRLPQFLLAAEDDLLILHVRGKAVGHEVMVFRARGPGLVPAGQPGIEAAADGAVGDVDDIPGGAQDHAFAAGVGAAPLGDDAGDGPDVGLNLRHATVRAHLVDDDLLGPLARDFGGILAEQFLFHFLSIDIQHQGAQVFWC